MYPHFSGWIVNVVPIATLTPDAAPGDTRTTERHIVTPPAAKQAPRWPRTNAGGRRD